MSDYMDRTLELGYTKGAAVLITILLASLFSWKRATGHLDVNRITTRTGEVFYWITILFSNTLGTALGDFLSDDSGLGFLGSWLLIAGLLVVLLGAMRFTRISRVVLFWVAFILTRPFGATFGDVLTKTHDQGGLDCGRGWASLILLAILGATIAVAYRKRRSGAAVPVRAVRTGR